MSRWKCEICGCNSDIELSLCPNGCQSGKSEVEILNDLVKILLDEIIAEKKNGIMEKAMKNAAGKEVIDFPVDSIHNPIPLEHEMYRCSNCRLNRPCYKHPWNKGEAEGSVSEIFGYVCTLEFDDDPQEARGYIYRNTETAGCECMVPTPEAIEKYRAMGKIQVNLSRPT